MYMSLQQRMAQPMYDIATNMYIHIYICHCNSAWHNIGFHCAWYNRVVVCKRAL